MWASSSVNVRCYWCWRRVKSRRDVWNGSVSTVCRLRRKYLFARLLKHLWVKNKNGQISCFDRRLVACLTLFNMATCIRPNSFFPLRRIFKFHRRSVFIFFNIYFAPSIDLNSATIKPIKPINQSHSSITHDGKWQSPFANLIFHRRNNKHSKHLLDKAN